MYDANLSIPPWSDFFLLYRQRRRQQMAAFNPTLVWFLLAAIRAEVPMLVETFNPTLVWFLPALSCGVSFQNFQSHLGLISSRKNPVALNAEVFLSIPPWSDFFWIEVVVKPLAFFFQSHLGLISSRLCVQRLHELYFQSHLGLISSAWIEVVVKPLAFSFNPTLVWFLLDELIPPILLPLKPFNPTLVWFLPWFNLPHIRHSGAFQSHLGLISSWLKTNIYDPLSSFNPTLVWFLLRLPVGPFKLWKLDAFNPTLVWFLQKTAATMNIEIDLSIPPWSDFFTGCRKSWKRRLRKAFNPTLVWFLHPPVVAFAKLIVRFLSIPPWSDFFCKTDLRLVRLVHYTFQSHLGLISSCCAPYSGAGDASFQSHLGLISSRKQKDMEAKRRTFQSHLGLISSYDQIHEVATALLSIPPWSDFFRK